MIPGVAMVHSVLDGLLTSRSSPGKPPRAYLDMVKQTLTVIAGDAKPEDLVILDRVERKSAHYDG